MSNEELKAIDPQLEEVVKLFQRELKNIRTGRANPSLVEDLEIEYFGTRTPLKQAAAISATDARCLVIAPWDKDNLVNIEKAINESDLNVNPTNDGSVIRITFPQLTQERRIELVKVMKKKSEETRIRVRKTREEFWDDVQKREKEGEISEDDKFRLKDSLQEIIDEYNEKIEELSKAKEEEIMTI